MDESLRCLDCLCSQDEADIVSAGRLEDNPDMLDTASSEDKLELAGDSTMETQTD
ncbi:hypothetical protein Bca52824_002630 [Brassica carinata]|uniref:Uncharacterized protein n=1 Tax=Brassica carinata TaxID=52824 RepID=A0A8X8BE19_BRACI|nr:hypothetical protein Bca52824_002630 [Brassica carinata]